MSLNGRRPRIIVESNTSSGHHHKPHLFVIGRPLIRWISCACIVLVGLYLLGPIGKFLFAGPHSPPPGYYHGHHFRPHHHPAEGHKAYPLPPPLHPHAGPPVTDIPDQSHRVQENKWHERAQKVKEAFVHAYGGYEKHALPCDELLPVSGGKVNK
jgi:mannosyl-oligosaccharide alpha-1,2-mannosidase